MHKTSYLISHCLVFVCQRLQRETIDYAHVSVRVSPDGEALLAALGARGHGVVLGCCVMLHRAGVEGRPRRALWPRVTERCGTGGGGGGQGLHGAHQGIGNLQERRVGWNKTEREERRREEKKTTKRHRMA